MKNIFSNMTRPQRGMSNNGWVYGYYYVQLDGSVYDLISSIDEEKGESNSYHVNSWTIGYNTGIKDKNGTEIFSDDLLRDSSNVVFRVYAVMGGFVIKSHYWAKEINHFDKTDYLICEPLSDAQTMSYIMQSCEVIGNIHDKKDLPF